MDNQTFFERLQHMRKENTLVQKDVIGNETLLEQDTQTDMSFMNSD